MVPNGPMASYRVDCHAKFTRFAYGTENSIFMTYCVTVKTQWNHIFYFIVIYII